MEHPDIIVEIKNKSRKTKHPPAGNIILAVD